MNKRLLIALCLVGSMPLSCGQSDDDDTPAAKSPLDKDASGNDTAATQLAADEELAGDSVAAQVDEAIAAVVEDQSESATSSSLQLADVDKSKKLERYRKCTAEGGKATVEIKKSAERSWTFEGPVRQGQNEFKQLAEVTRIWSREGGTVACAASGKHADLKRTEMKGVSLAAKFKRTRSRSASLTNTKKGTTKSRSAKFNAEGSRTISWSDVQVKGGQITLTKTVSQEVTRTLEITNKKGEQKTLEQTVSTDPTAPLKIVVVRSESSDALVSRTIVSGKKVATFKDGGRIETSFDNVKYEAGKGCYASSGKITGAVYGKDQTEPATSFTIDFAADGNSISFVGGKEVDYVADGCEIDVESVEADSTAVSDKDSSADVKAPT